jgi:DNA-binding GntR family transcriptional regulator
MVAENTAEVLMAGRGQAQPKRIAEDQAGTSGPRRSNGVNLFELAYERLEDLIIRCELKPGRFLTIQDLQELTGFSRTPVHQAVSRLADDTLILVRPRHGLQIAPIDLARERVLLELRRSLERFLIRLAAERLGSSHRNQFLHMERLLREQRGEMTIEEFNVVDRRIDKLILSAANEPFLEHTVRPLHTIFRRVGWIYHNNITRNASPSTTIDCHLAILGAVANKHIEKAMAASDELMDFVDSMFEVLEGEVPPEQFDCSLEPFAPLHQ